MSKYIYIIFYVAALLVVNCTHTYDKLPVKKSNCLRYNAERNIIEFVCQEKRITNSPMLTISVSKASLDTSSASFQVRFLESTRLFYYSGDNKLPYEIKEQFLDTLDFLNFIVYYQKKKFELSLYKGFKKDSLYYFKEY
jgi:hypothetical protein